jgi:hypothetical protein
MGYGLPKSVVVQNALAAFFCFSDFSANPYPFGQKRVTIIFEFRIGLQPA